MILLKLLLLVLHLFFDLWFGVAFNKYLLILSVMVAVLIVWNEVDHLLFAFFARTFDKIQQIWRNFNRRLFYFDYFFLKRVRIDLFIVILLIGIDLQTFCQNDEFSVYNSVLFIRYGLIVRIFIMLAYKSP